MTTDSDDRPDLSTLRIKRDRAEAEEGPRRRIGLRAVLLVVLALCAILVAYAFISGRFAGATEVDLAAASLTSPSAANAVLTASGYVVAQQQAAVASKGTGRLVFLSVEEGDRVRKGQIIARLEDQDVIAALARARADLAVAQADVEDAEQGLHRQQTLFSRGLTSQAELDAAEARYGRVQALVQAAQAAVQAAEVELENTRIRAPFDGTVLTKNADVGEVVAPFASSANSRGAVVTIANMGSLLVEADVSEANITRVRRGQRCEIVLDAYPDHRYEGAVHKIVPTADRAKATVLTKVAFLERDERVLPEMSAKVTFLSAAADTVKFDARQRLTLPASAIVERSGAKVAMRVREGTVTEVPLKTGETLAGRVEILDGISPGDQVVLNPGPELTTGSRVRPRDNK